MSLKIERGLFKYDFLDYHAVLCIPVDADTKEIRKRYLKIARQLHPDSCVNASEAEKRLANELLSKMVNPAYEKLSVERNRAEYMLILSQIGKRLIQEQASIELTGDLSKQLANAPSVDLLYKNTINKIAETQFNNLQQVPQIIAQISELNLVYLMRGAAQSISKPQPLRPPVNATATPTASDSKSAGVKPVSKPTEPEKEDSVAENYIRRALNLMEKNQFAQAKVELQDALKLEPKNSRCHSLIGKVYLNQNQLKMAKVHFDNALKLDPKDALALEWKPKVDKVIAKQHSTNPAAHTTSASGHGDGESDKSGGLFGGLFGGKKK
jgi:Fe-S protein assembly co-chaperone HscB